MLSLPVKLTRAQTRLLKKENLVCVGVGSFANPLFGEKRLDCQYINLARRKPEFESRDLRGSCDTYLYFPPDPNFSASALPSGRT